MKNLLLSIACGIAAFNVSAASYTVDFNTAIDTSDTAFTPAPGWKHIVNTGSYTSQKVDYDYSATDGVDNSGCLKVGKQSYFDYFEYEDVTLNDLLVTPEVSGNVTIDVKPTSTNGNIKFYKVTEANGKLVRGDEITATGEDLVIILYTTLTLPNVEPGTRIGIRAEEVYIDNFTAEQVNLQLEKGLTIVSSSSNATGNVDCNSDNKFAVGGKVKFKNTGDLDIESGKDSFSVAMMKQDESGDFIVDKIVGTFTIDEDIPVGATSKDIAFEALVNESDVTPVNGSKSRRYDIVSDIASTSKILCNVTPISHLPIPAYSTAKSSSLKQNDEIDLGIVTGSGDIVLTISNNGAAEMSIKNIEVTGAGFSCNPNANIVIPKHESKDITINLTSDIIGEKTGEITITAENLEPISFSLKGNVLDPDAWYVNFEDNKFPGNMIAGAGWTISGSLAIEPNKYYAVGAEIPSMLISPLLKVAEGENISFEAARCHGTSSINVYTSTDRSNWTLIRTLSPEAVNETDKLSSDYYGTAWGSNTKYVFTGFTLEELPEEPFYLAFEAGNARIDNILGGKVAEVEHDIYVDEIIAPAVGMVNNRIIISASVKNLLANIEEDDSYSISLMNGDEEIVSAEPIDIEGYSANKFNFEFTPHQEGELNLKIVFAEGEYLSESKPFNITVNKELALVSKQVGNVTITEQSKTAPLNLYNYKSQSETVYTADLIGLAKGAKITKLIYKGKGSSAKSIDINLKVWMENTDDDAPQSVLLKEGATDNMSLIYDGKYSINASKETSDMLVLDLAEPFEYTGGNIRIVMNHESNGFVTSYFELDGNVAGQSLVRAHDSKLPTTFSAGPLPVVYMEASTEPSILEGVITNTKGANIANAKVELTSGDVLYSATTDESGAYTMEVIQTKLDFTLTVTAEGYKTYSDDIQLEEPKTTQNVILEAESGSTVTEISVDNDDDAYYDLNGFRLKAKPTKGTYIHKGKVYIAE